MSHGGHSFHKKDWALLAAATGLAATGAGAAGIGPMAGLMGGAGAAGAAGAGAAGAGEGLLGASGLAEMGSAGAATPGIGSYLAASSAPVFGADSTAGMAGGAADLAGAPQAANPFSIGMGNLNSQYGGILKGGMKGLNMAKQVGLFSQPQQQAPMGPRGGGMQQPSAPTQILSQSAPTMPLDLLGLPPDDPKVIAWKQQNGVK
jgi:hypothetical protein